MQPAKWRELHTFQYLEIRLDFQRAAETNW
jgi:hypothetical protein